MKTVWNELLAPFLSALVFGGITLALLTNFAQ